MARKALIERITDECAGVRYEAVVALDRIDREDRRVWEAMVEQARQSVVETETDNLLARFRILEAMGALIDELGVGEALARELRMGPMVVQQTIHYIGELLEGEVTAESAELAEHFLCFSAISARSAVERN